MVDKKCLTVKDAFLDGKFKTSISKNEYKLEHPSGYWMLKTKKADINTNGMSKKCSISVTIFLSKTLDWILFQ